jgi:nucleoid DNA-binding protein
MSELLEDVTGYYSLTDLVNQLESQFGIDENVLRDLVQTTFKNIAEAAGIGENLVVLDGIGSFKTEGRQGRSYRIGEKVVEKGAYIKFKFKAATELRQIVKGVLPEPIKNLPVK